MNTHEEYMRKALEEAKMAEECGELVRDFFAKKRGK